MQITARYHYRARGARAAEPVADHPQSRPANPRCKGRAEVIVHVHDGVLQRIPGEELCLRLAIATHRAVVFQMIPGEVRKDGDVELDTGDAVLVESD